MYKYKYKYKGFMLKIWKDWVFILPCIELHLEDLRYFPPEIIEISIHWLIIHCRWLWRKEVEYCERSDN